MVLILLITVVGCAQNEVIRVATPFFKETGNEGVEFYDEITNSEKIGDLRHIIKAESNIEQPKELAKVADIFFTLDILKEKHSEIRRFVWYQNDGTSILYSEGSDNYSVLTKEQTDELKVILKTD